VFLDRERAWKHIVAGAKKVLITTPGKGDIPTYVVGVNEYNYRLFLNIIIVGYLNLEMENVHFII